MTARMTAGSRSESPLGSVRRPARRTPRFRWSRRRRASRRCCDASDESCSCCSNAGGLAASGGIINIAAVLLIDSPRFAAGWQEGASQSCPKSPLMRMTTRLGPDLLTSSRPISRPFRRIAERVISKSVACSGVEDSVSTRIRPGVWCSSEIAAARNMAKSDASIAFSVSSRTVKRRTENVLLAFCDAGADEMFASACSTSCDEIGEAVLGQVRLCSRSVSPKGAIGASVLPGLKVR